MLKNIPIRVATSVERYCGGEQKWWSQPVSRPPCTPNQQAIANYSKLYPGGPIPHNHGDGFDAPPTLERSGSEHRRAVTSFLLRFLSPTRGTEGVVKTIERGLVRKVEFSLQERRRGRKKPLSTRKDGMICMQSHFDNHVM